MTRTSNLRIAAFALLASACADTTTPLDPETQLNSDVAMYAGDAAAVDAEVMRGAHGGRFGLGLLARIGNFECNRETPRQLTVVRTCTFRDAAGNVQAAYNAQTTATANVHVEISGDVQRDRWSGTVDRERDLTASGLLGNETQITWNGTGSGSSTRVRMSDGGESRTYEFSGSTTITNVVIPVPQTATSWPRSGTITRTVTVRKADGSTGTRTVSVTFNGTQFVPVTVNGETFEFDLASRGRPRR
ncbi:MAG: hypothetical protein ACT4OZ_09320 [Gemmatimonadota bacterium]